MPRGDSSTELAAPAHHEPDVADDCPMDHHDEEGIDLAMEFEEHDGLGQDALEDNNLDDDVDDNDVHDDDVDDDDLDDSKVPLSSLMLPGPAMFLIDDDDDSNDDGFPARCHWPEGRPVSNRDGVFFFKPVAENDGHDWYVAFQDDENVHSIYYDEDDEWGAKGGR